MWLSSAPRGRCTGGSPSPEETVEGKGNVFHGQEPPSGESTYYHHLWGELSTTCSNATDVAQWETPIVTVNHRQLRIMASETIDPIE